MSVSGPWHFAFWEHDVTRRFRLLCVLPAFLISPGVRAAQSDDLLAHISQGGFTVLVEGERMTSGAVSA